MSVLCGEACSILGPLVVLCLRLFDGFLFLRKKSGFPFRYHQESRLPVKVGDRPFSMCFFMLQPTVTNSLSSSLKEPGPQNALARVLINRGCKSKLCSGFQLAHSIENPSYSA